MSYVGYLGESEDLSVAVVSATKNLQQLAKNEGFYKGPIDGIVGPETRAAVIALSTRELDSLDRNATLILSAGDEYALQQLEIIRNLTRNRGKQRILEAQTSKDLTRLQPLIEGIGRLQKNLWSSVTQPLLDTLGNYIKSARQAAASAINTVTLIPRTIAEIVADAENARREYPTLSTLAIIAAVAAGGFLVWKLK